MLSHPNVSLGSKLKDGRVQLDVQAIVLVMQMNTCMSEQQHETGTHSRTVVVDVSMCIVAVSCYASFRMVFVCSGACHWRFFVAVRPRKKMFGRLRN